MKSFDSVGLRVPEILLPVPAIDLEKWSVVACDQYTSQPDYWETVEHFIGEAPSTYHMILPEAYLGSAREEEHASRVYPMMQNYLSQGIFQEFVGFILVKRNCDGFSRVGLIAALDLEYYDYQHDSQSLIRATEGTIIERLPARIAIREKAELEIPHILVLIDDPKMSVINPLLDHTLDDAPLYDFDLMQGGGHITGYLIKTEFNQQIVAALEGLKNSVTQTEKYGVSPETPPMLYAMGDGNHSLAAAKAIWEKNKKDLPMDHPSRFALVEIVNLHDPAIEFEAIHRLVKHQGLDFLQQCKEYFKGEISITSVGDFAEIRSQVDSTKDDQQLFGLFYDNKYFNISIDRPTHTLTVGNVQSWLDNDLSEKRIVGIDYIHGADTILDLGMKDKHAGIYLPPMPKNALFRSVIKDGPLPRKTFSMGEAHQKRFYLECRKIIE
jgi:hypothetical protein